MAAPCLDAAAPALRRLLQEGIEISRNAAIGFVTACDPEDRPAPEEADAETLIAWMDAVVYTVLPPIRPISPGLTDIYESPDRQQLVEVGSAGLLDFQLFGAQCEQRILPARSTERSPARSSVTCPMASNRGTASPQAYRDAFSNSAICQSSACGTATG